MTITPVDWPAVLKPQSFGYSLNNADISGGLAIGGGEQIVASAGPRWEADMSLGIWNNDQVRALRALSVLLMGRAVPVKLPNFDGQRLVWAEPGESEILATLAANAALHATTVVVSVSQVLPGQQFGIADRLYQIGTVTAGAIVSGVRQHTLTFWPPLRAAATAGAVVQFTRPYCLMRCLNLNAEFRQLELLRFATLNLEFAEYG
jgi:hypothetical protein